MLTAINKQNPTTTIYVLSLLLLCMTFVSYGQEVFENFAGFSVSTFGDHEYNDFFLTDGSRSNAASSIPYAMRLRQATSSLEYLGCDGNGKDGGVGTVSFQYRLNSVRSGRESPDARLRVQKIINGIATNVGVVPVVMQPNSGDFGTATIPVNDASDNIKIRIYFSPLPPSFTGTDVIIDDVRITNHSGVKETTWNGSSWSDGTPDSDDIAIIEGHYNTSISRPSFSAGSLIVRNGADLIINNGYHVEVKNNVTVENASSIDVETQGAFVQRGLGDAAGCFTLKGGTARVKKQTATLTSASEYTYWSSPVKGELISGGLAEANPGRIYYYEAQNYKDSQRLVNNMPSGAGQDDVDDDYDDWQPAPGTDEMLAGVGYAATHSSAAFASATGCPSCQIPYEFTGAFNNGDIEIPIYRNDNELSDNNWNFIGNPYASAINADVFLGANTSLDQSTDDLSPIVRTLDGAIFFWSHATAASTSANGNNASNYAQSDYAIINGVGQIHGGDGVMPTRHIPSGQGFFVSMADGGSPDILPGNIKRSHVVFNNDMRVTGNNAQFFRSSGIDGPNKLWINLDSDNGVRNQILVAYANGATDNFDGMYYDTYKNLSTDINAEIYTTIEDSGDKKFAIQGKDPNSLTLDEVIPFGFNTSIAVPTLYTISIGQFEGAFMTANTIYLKDNLLNTIHNLKDSDYTFTSEVGDFDTRFEIVFTPQALSVDDNVLDASALTITELTTTDVAFNVGKGFSITNVKIFDLLGRQIYDLEGSSSREVYNLAKLSKAAYIAKVTLDNGQVLSKKAIKQK